MASAIRADEAMRQAAKRRRRAGGAQQVRTTIYKGSPESWRKYEDRLELRLAG